jgi:hypothetical protein
MTASYALTLYRHKLMAMIILIFFEHTWADHWKMYPSVWVFTYGFNIMVLHHSTVMKCFEGCPKIIVDMGPFSWPACWHALNSLDSFQWGYLKTNVFFSTVSTREELWHKLKQFASEIKNTPEIFKCLRVSFSCSVSRTPLVRKCKWR